MSEQNKALARTFYEAFASGEVDRLDEIMAEDAVDHDTQNPFAGNGREGAKQAIAMYRAAFSDLRFEIEDQVAEGDMVVTRWTGTGTQDGELMGAPASGKVSIVSGITVDRIEDGKIAEGWTSWDTLGMLQQLGLAEQPAAAQA